MATVYCKPRVYWDNQLPFELLCMIFDHLDLRSIKRASLVCQRWEQVIFSDHYIKRFRQHIPLSRQTLMPFPRNSFHLHKQSPSHAMKEMDRTLKASYRCYTNLTLEFDHRSEFTNHAFHVLFGILGSPKLEQLVVLKLILKAEPDLMLGTVLNALPGMFRLQALHITPESGYRFDLEHKYRLHLKSETLQHLELKAFLPDSMCLPCLKSLDVSLHLMVDMVYGQQYTKRQEDLLYCSQFEELEELTFSQLFKPLESGSIPSTTNRPGYKMRFYKQLKNLKKLRLFEQKTPESTFLAIYKSCTSLTELWIECLQTLDPNVLRHLSKLPHLRSLAVNSFISRGPISFAGVHLPNLERLRLGTGPFVVDTFEAFATVKHLELKLTPSDEEKSLRAIAKHLPELTVLWLNFESVCNSETVAAVQMLYRLKSVRELVLERGYFSKALRVAATRPIPRLKTLRFRRCTFPSTETSWLRYIFPNLDQLDIPDCNTFILTIPRPTLY